MEGLVSTPPDMGGAQYAQLRLATVPIAAVRSGVVTS